MAVMPGDRGFMNPGSPRFRGCSKNSGNWQASKADSAVPENRPSLCHPYREGRKTVLESLLAAMRPPVSTSADSEDYFRFPEQITKKRLEIKSFLLFFEDFQAIRAARHRIRCSRVISAGKGSGHALRPVRRPGSAIPCRKPVALAPDIPISMTFSSIRGAGVDFTGNAGSRHLRLRSATAPAGPPSW